MKNYFRMFVRNFCCTVFFGAFVFSVTLFANDANLKVFEKNLKKKSNGDVVINGIVEKYAQNMKFPEYVWAFLDYYKCGISIDSINDKFKSVGHVYWLFPKFNEHFDLPYTFEFKMAFKTPDLDEIIRENIDSGCLIMATFRKNEELDFVIERTLERKKYESNISRWRNILRKNKVKKFGSGQNAKGIYIPVFAMIYGYNKKTNEFLALLEEGKLCTLTEDELKQEVFRAFFMSDENGKDKEKSGKRKLKL